MKTKGNIVIFTIILFALYSNSAFSEESTYKLIEPRGKIGFGIVFPFPMAFEINTKFLDIGIGINYIDIKNFLLN